jgi:hypothetical protein
MCRHIRRAEIREPSLVYLFDNGASVSLVSSLREAWLPDEAQRRSLVYIF